METKIKVYIVEDIAISRMSLETMLLENNYNVIGSAADAETAWEQLQMKPADLILLDINLAGLKNGVWLAQQVRKYLNIPIIYLTAYGDQQTLKEVVETKPNGYLMKPYQEPTLLTSIEIALQNFSNVTTEKFLFIKEKLSKVKINIDTILYVKSDGNYLEIVLQNKKHVIRGKLLEFKKELPLNQFLQSHQRYVVNIDKVTLLSKNLVELHDKKIPLSAKYKAALEIVLFAK
mgnify:FL=1